MVGDRWTSDGKAIRMGGTLMIYITADLHFGHANIIRLDGRPYANVEEMDKELVKNWNNTVNDEDEVWILGDLFYKNSVNAEEYLKQLKGHKNLIIGNHDRPLVSNSVYRKYFEYMGDMRYFPQGVIDKQHATIFCHYPMAEWNGSYHDAVMVYAHIHNNRNETFEYMRKRYGMQALNAGCMINGYKPVTYAELVENNRAYLKSFGVKKLN